MFTYSYVVSAAVIESYSLHEIVALCVGEERIIGCQQSITVKIVKVYMRRTVSAISWRKSHTWRGSIATMA